MTHSRSALLSVVLGAMVWALSAAGAGAAEDYDRAVWTKWHFSPAIDQASNADCLTCHSEILQDKVREKSPAGAASSGAKAWYQTMSTYKGQQETFHRRHMVTPYAQQVMDLKCNTCHVGHDPRDKSEPALAQSTAAQPFTLRKDTNPEQTCLLCHGTFPAANMELPGPWKEIKADMEPEGVKNGCLTCHADTFRTERHKVNYLKADNIEKLAQESSDVCYGCHGGRQWYRISYPYPRHKWPGMPDETPDWAKDRPTESNPRFLHGTKK